VPTNTVQVFFNPDTFQLAHLGLDGVATAAPINRTQFSTPVNNDNIANFAGGRFDGFDWEEALELGGRNPE